MHKILIILFVLCSVGAYCFVAATAHKTVGKRSNENSTASSKTVPKARLDYGSSENLFPEENDDLVNSSPTSSSENNSEFPADYNSKSFQQQQQQHENTTVIIDIKFLAEFAKFNPRSNSSEFHFFVDYPPLNLLSDNALFLPGEYGILNMISKPFNHYLPQSYGSPAVLTSYEVLAQSNALIAVEDGQVLSVELELTCRTFNVKLNPFPPGSIANVNNDPRLGACGYSVVDLDRTGIDFGFYLTNTGIWIKYRRGARARSVLMNYDAFEIYRPVGLRTGTNDLVKFRIEIDRNVNETRWIVNEKLVWTVERWGVVSNALFDGKTRLVGFSPGSPPVGAAQIPITPGRFTVLINTIKKLDDADPNGPPTRVPNNSPSEYSVDASQYSPGLVRFSNATGFYDPNMTFVDNLSLRFNNIWGQGAVSGLSKLLAQTYTSPQRTQGGSTSPSQNGGNAGAGGSSGGAANEAYGGSRAY